MRLVTGLQQKCFIRFGDVTAVGFWPIQGTRKDYQGWRVCFFGGLEKGATIARLVRAEQVAQGGKPELQRWLPGPGSHLGAASADGTGSPIGPEEMTAG